jgi:hypothetical protein
VETADVLAELLQVYRVLREIFGMLLQELVLGSEGGLFRDESLVLGA